MKVVCQVKECKQQSTHYLVSEPYKREINGTTHILVSCEMNERYLRDILPEEAYWHGEHKETSRTTSNTEGIYMYNLHIFSNNILLFILTEEIDLSESNVEVNHHISGELVFD